MFRALWQLILNQDKRVQPTILHVITGLADGGAEANLYRLCVSDKNNRHIVVSLTDEGKYGSLLREHKVQVRALNMRSKSVSPLKVWSLIKLFRSVNPDVVHTWMYHGCLLGSIAAKCTGTRPVVWGIHHSKLDRQGLKPVTFAIMKFLGIMSRHTSDAIVYCAKSAALAHKQHGYRTRHERIVPNGYDLSVFKPDKKSRTNTERSFTLGMVARWDPIKDINNLCQALQKVAQAGWDFQLVLAGSGMHGENPKMRKMLADYELQGRAKMLGAIDYVPELMRSLDLHILSSMGEAFPNVLAEAMACGTPCITTDVGDASDIVGETGWVVPPRDPIALAGAIKAALNEWNGDNWRARCEEACKRIHEKFSMERMVDGFNEVWGEVLEKP